MAEPWLPRQGRWASVRDGLRPPLTRPLRRAVLLRNGFGGSPCPRFPIPNLGVGWCDPSLRIRRLLDVDFALGRKLGQNRCCAGSSDQPCAPCRTPEAGVAGSNPAEGTSCCGG